MASSSGVQRRAVTATSRLDRRRPQVMARPAAVAPITSPREETASCAAWRAIRICFERMLTAHVRETSPAFLVEVTVGWGWRLVATKAL